MRPMSGEKGVDVPLSSGGLAISNTLEFLLSPARDAEAAKRFFSKTPAAPHTMLPRVLTVNKNAANPKAFKVLKEEGDVPDNCKLTSASNISTISSNKITGSSNDVSNWDRASFPLRARGEPCKDMRS